MVSETEKPAVPRLKTGVPRLDFICKGGLVKGASYLIYGPPGSGKTILANQICFNTAREGLRSLYVTLLTESHSRMLGNLRTLDFFDESLIPDRLQYLSGYGVLEKQGLKGLLQLIREAMRSHRADLMVIDGFDTARERAGADLSLKEFLHELQAHASLLGTTTVFLTPTLNGEASLEATAVDGVIELSQSLKGPRGVRELTVHKFRGSDSLAGRHEVEITQRGIVVHPRTEVQFDEPPASAEENRIRMPFGVARLDEQLHGGVLSGSTTTILGAPGTGKTLLGLQFLAEGAREGQPGVYFGFYETPPRLIEKAESCGIPLRQFVDSGMVEIQWQPPLEHNLDALAEKLVERIRERRVERLRVFVDGMAGFRTAAVYPERMGRFLSALAHQLRLLDATTVFSEESPLFRPGVEMPNEDLGGAVENIIFLRYVELRSQLYRLISILKVRESAYDAAIREFSITSDGIEVADSFETAEAVLSGQAREIAPRRVKTPMGSKGAAKKRARGKSPKRGRKS